MAILMVKCQIYLKVKVIGQQFGSKSWPITPVLLQQWPIFWPITTHYWPITWWLLSHYYSLLYITRRSCTMWAKLVSGLYKFASYVYRLELPPKTQSKRGCSNTNNHTKIKYKLNTRSTTNGSAKNRKTRRSLIVRIVIWIIIRIRIVIGILVVVGITVVFPWDFSYFELPDFYRCFFADLCCHCNDGICLWFYLGSWVTSILCLLHMSCLFQNPIFDVRFHCSFVVCSLYLGVF